MNGINGRDLDNYITGHYGEDQFRHGEIEREEAIWDDEGYQILDAAKSHIMSAADFEADDILRECMGLIEQDFECLYCGDPLPRKKSYCSSSCYKAAYND